MFKMLKMFKASHIKVSQTRQMSMTIPKASISTPIKLIIKIKTNQKDYPKHKRP